MSFTHFLRKLAGRVLSPFSNYPFSPGKVFSPLETVAIKNSLDSTETLFARAPKAEELTQALVRYFGDEDARYALKKAVHLVVETQQRIMAVHSLAPRSPWYDHYIVPEGRHPLNRYVEDGLEAETVMRAADKPFDVTRLWIGTALLALALSAQALVLGLKWGMGRVTKRTFTAIWVDSISDNVLYGFAAAARDLGVNVEDYLAKVVHGAADGARIDGHCTLVDGSALGVPMGKWFRDVTVPTFALTASLLAVLMRSGDARTLTVAGEAARVAYHSFAYWRAAYNIRCRWVLDCIEYNSNPIVKGIVFRKFGAKTAFWPISQIDSHGSGLSYMTYDAWLSGGTYQEEAYGASWSPRCKTVPLGMPTHDRHITHGKYLSRDAVSEIEERLQRGEKMAVYFGQRSSPHQISTWFEPLAAMIEIFADRSGWFLVIKSKHGTSTLDSLLDADPRTHNWRAAGNVVTIAYPELGGEVCPTGWLAQRMTLAYSIGSAQIECLTRGKPVVSFVPVATETPLERKMAEQGLFHTEPKSFRRAMKAFAERPEDMPVDFDWFRRAFDQPADDSALVRMVGFVLGDMSAPALQEKTKMKVGTL